MSSNRLCEQCIVQWTDKSFYPSGASFILGFYFFYVDVFVSWSFVSWYFSFFDVLFLAVFLYLSLVSVLGLLLKEEHLRQEESAEILNKKVERKCEGHLGWGVIMEAIPKNCFYRTLSQYDEGGGDSHTFHTHLSI